MVEKSKNVPGFANKLPAVETSCPVIYCYEMLSVSDGKYFRPAIQDVRKILDALRDESLCEKLGIQADTRDLQLFCDRWDEIMLGLQDTDIIPVGLRYVGYADNLRQRQKDHLSSNVLCNALTLGSPGAKLPNAVARAAEHLFNVQKLRLRLCSEIIPVVKCIPTAKLWKDS